MPVNSVSEMQASRSLWEPCSRAQEKKAFQLVEGVKGEDSTSDPCFLWGLLTIAGITFRAHLSLPGGSSFELSRFLLGRLCITSLDYFHSYWETTVKSVVYALAA